MAKDAHWSPDLEAKPPANRARGDIFSFPPGPRLVREPGHGRGPGGPGDPQTVDTGEGVKADGEKPRWDLLPFDALEAIAEVMTYGAAKYEDRNWERGMRWGRPFAAMLRHVTRWWQGEDNDPETGFNHLAHAGCCLLFLLSFALRRGGRFMDYDDRPPLWTQGVVPPPSRTVRKGGWVHHPDPGNPLQPGMILDDPIDPDHTKVT